MSEKKEDLFETGEFIFYHAISELSYIKKSIEIIEENLSSSINNLNIEYERSIEEKYKDNSYGLSKGEFIKVFMPIIDDNSNIMSTINESILTKIYSIFEKAVILFAYEIQRYYECKIPPHFNMPKNTYTNILSAREYIFNLSDFDLCKIDTWNAIINLRNTRNRLSHGNTLLKMDETQVNQINIEFKKHLNESNIPLLIKVEDEKVRFRVNEDIKILYIARKLVTDTIIILDAYYTHMRIRDNKFELDSYLYGEGATEEFLETLNIK